MSLPKPVLSNSDLVSCRDGSYESATLIWNTWSRDPIKAAVLRVVLACESSNYQFGVDMTVALSQTFVGFLHSFSLEAEELHY